MPVRRNYSSNTVTVSCSQCGQSRTGEGYTLGSDAVDTASGALITEFIRYLPARGRWHSQCRSCERAQRTLAPNRPARRAGGQRGAQRKFGVELELKFPRGRRVYDIEAALRAAGVPVRTSRDAVTAGWRVKGDGSLTRGNGIEVVSPPLSGEAGMDQLRTVTRVLREQGAKVDSQCGTHIHHDVSDLTVDNIKHVVRSWKNQTPMIDGVVAPSRRSHQAPYYCRSLTDTEVTRIEAITSLAGMRNVGVDRYRSLNMQAYGKFGTIEIRQHQGTNDFEKIRSWVMLGQAIIDTAKVTGAPMPARTTFRGMIEALGDRLDDTAATFLLGRAVRFAAVTL